MDLTSILGTINNQVLTKYMADGTTPMNNFMMWDIPYIVKSLTFLLSLWFIYKCILIILRKIGD